MFRTESNSALIDAIEELEVSLESPLVPGDMADWADAVRQSCARLQPVLTDQVYAVHAHAIDQIKSEDPELSTCAANLRHTDEITMQQFARIANWVSNLPERVNQVEPDEGCMTDELHELIHDGLNFVLHVRGQETALRTWMVESLYRDRGAVD